MKGYKSYIGMCPKCVEKNKTELVFCTHGLYEYFYKLNSQK